LTGQSIRAQQGSEALGDRQQSDCVNGYLVPPAVIENPLTVVVIGAVAFSIVMCILFLVTRGTDSMYDHIGAGGLSREGEAPSGGAAPMASPHVDRAEQEREIRQMLVARNDRLVRRGEPPLDVESELDRLLSGLDAPTEHDAALVAEVRQMVLARNERRERQGQPPLDVDAEVERTLAELDP
jgi:hypothetical protein